LAKWEAWNALKGQSRSVHLYIFGMMHTILSIFQLKLFFIVHVAHLESAGDLDADMSKDNATNAYVNKINKWMAYKDSMNSCNSPRTPVTKKKPLDFDEAVRLSATASIPEHLEIKLYGLLQQVPQPP